MGEHGAMDDRLPLSALLSHALVAYTVELDNEFEHRMPHRTTDHGRTPGPEPAPWLVSLVMWASCMQFVPGDGITVAELERRARTPTNLGGMERWGYVQVRPGATDGRRRAPQSACLVVPTAGGRRAQEVWAPLFGLTEQRWADRFGADAVGRLREALVALHDQFEPGLPQCLPIQHHGLFTRHERTDPPGADDGDDVPLSALLSRALLVFALDYEAQSEVSLAIGANVLRVLGDEPMRPADLPDRTGTSKQAVAMVLGVLEKRSLISRVPNPSGRGKVVLLTEQGREVRRASVARIDAIETGWHGRFGPAVVADLRAALEPLAAGTSGDVPLRAGMTPYPDGWRAAVPPPSTLPYFPTVLHRGGYPDGS
jgi:DNA-binding MarR family transcriptional regulator